jgi:hypothetical protein
MALVLEHAQDDRAKVTGGIPSLDSSRRKEITESALMQVYQRACQAEYRNNEAAATADDGDRTTKDWDAQVGIPLIGARIIGRLKKLNPNLWFEVSNADKNKTGVYILKNDGKGGQEKQFICGMETELSPEFSVRVVDEQGKLKGEIRGWRTMLMRLIKAGFIQQEAAFRLFGPPNRDSANWARFMS